jgi:hypothetical protein
LIFACLPQRRKNRVFSFFVINLNRAVITGPVFFTPEKPGKQARLKNVRRGG